MKLKKLTKLQVEALYKGRMAEDFPPDELKPLDRIFIAMNNVVV